MITIFLTDRSRFSSAPPSKCLVALQLSNWSLSFAVVWVWYRKPCPAHRKMWNVRHYKNDNIRRGKEERARSVCSCSASEGAEPEKRLSRSALRKWHPPGALQRLGCSFHESGHCDDRSTLRATALTMELLQHQPRIT